MCGRKLLIDEPAKLKKLFGITKGPTPNWPARYNIAITDREPIVRLHDGHRSLELATWDYGNASKQTNPKTGKRRPPVFNMRGETMMTSDTFAERRCLVPVSGFYEWSTVNGTKQPFAFMREDREPFAMGGVWKQAEELTYVELTVEPTKLVEEIHNRMPLIIDPAHWDEWLNDSAAAKKLVKPNPLKGFIRFPVSPAVNSVKNEGPELIEPFTPSTNAQASFL